jgi:alanine racemase
MIPNEVIIDLGAIKHNLAEIKRLAGRDTRIAAVVKSDAYGHGMIPVAKTLESAGINYLGVFEYQEALDLRKAGCKVPILIMMGITADEVSDVVENQLTTALFQRDIAKNLSNTALERGVTVPVHVKVDTGMTRLGVPWANVTDFLRSLSSLKGIRIEGIFSHLAVADVPDEPFTGEQIRRFLHAVEASRRTGVCDDAVHVANSAALLGNRGLEVGMIRPGILLYGSPPSPGWKAASAFRPAMTFRSRVIQVRRVPAGTSVSYGRTYTAPESTRIATIPVGYDDGYSRRLSNQGEVLLHGTRVPIVGRVCMNLTMLDVSSLRDVAVGDEVVLLGVQGEAQITAEEIAEKAGTISYDVYCSLGKSNRRTYVDSS